MAFMLATVHGGVYRGYDGQPVTSGKVTFTPESPGWIAAPASATDYVPEPVTASIVDGEITVTLVGPAASDDPTVSYRVQVQIPPGLEDAYTITMPIVTDGVTLELASRDPDTGVLAAGTGGGGGGGFGGDGHGGFGA